MKNTIKILKGLLVVPILAIINLMSNDECEEVDGEIVSATPLDRKLKYEKEWQEYFNWKVIPIETRKEKIIGDTKNEFIRNKCKLACIDR